MRHQLRSPLGIATLAALVLWLVGLSDALSHLYWNISYKLYDQPAPSTIAVVSSDDVLELGATGEARLFDAIRAQHPAHVYMDTALAPAATPQEGERLNQSLARFGRDVSFVVRSSKFDRFDAENFRFPAKSVIAGREVLISGWYVNFIYYYQSSPYVFDINGVRYNSLAKALSGRGDDWSFKTIYPDFSINPATIMQISGRDLIRNNGLDHPLQGKAVIVSSSGQGPVGGYFGHKLINAVAADIAGAAAIDRPFSLNLTMLPLLLLVLLLIRGGSRTSAKRWKLLCYGCAIAAPLALPIALRLVGLVNDPDGAMVAILTYGGIRFWQRRTRHIRQTSTSGLPNLLALTTTSLPVGRDVIVAAIGRYEEILATLPQELHGECARQIARRITVGSASEDIYHSEGGHFAWTEEARPLDLQINHLEGLRALFSAPLQIGPHTFDTNIHFGLDRNEGMDTLTRVNAALASANDALSNGRAVELFEAHRLAEAPWELSLHARIDEGLRNGDIWLAFQSQWDIESGTICGAEALIRWNHPTRGPIAPDAFILQAERAGRIDSLTYWVVDHAITAALAINARGRRFQMSVNLSAQMVDKPDLVANFAEILRRRGIDPQLLTIEVTETSSVRNRPAACHNLTLLRQMGFRLSIDDFGTGEASLAYLADLPSDELKIDRRFISRITSNDRDRTIVASTIDLAHALGQHVVAEGIEDAATLALLRDLGCDLAQGYHLGRPQPFTVFEREYEASLLKGVQAV